MIQGTGSEQELELKKHVNAIHCTNNLTLVQRKLFNALLFNAYNELPYKSQFEIPVKTLCKLIGYNSNDYETLKKALLVLITIAIEWNVIDFSSPEKPSKWRASAILSAAKLENGICTYEYSNVMRELLYRPEVYGRLNMVILSRFKSSYGLALYENCIRYQDIPQTPWFPIEIFRKLMGVFGDKYATFNDFKKRILNIAVDEVNRHSPLTISPEIKRRNQKVVSLRFKIENKPSTLDECLDVNIEKDGLIKDLTNDFGLSVEIIQNILSKYDVKYIEEKVNIIKKSDNFRNGSIRNLSGYLIDALKKDYKNSKSSKEIMNIKRDNREKTESLKRNSEEMRQKIYNQYVNNIVQNYLSKLHDNTYQKLIDEFELDLKNYNITVFRWYIKEGLDHPAVKASLNYFLKSKKLDGLEDIKSFDEFVSQ